jgi:phospholipase/carboxylesterase
VSPLHYSERAAAGEPVGLLVLHHGRGSDDRDLLALADLLDPGRALHVVAPRAPLTLAGWPGQHWYVVERVGYPEPETFHAGFRQLAAFHDALWARVGLGPERTVLGGFSQGAVMSYALGLAGERPRPAGILALSGFIPTVDGWRPDYATCGGLEVFIGHGNGDKVIAVQFGRAAREALERNGARVEYDEADGGHEVGPTRVAKAAAWLAATLAPAPSLADGD